MSWDYRLLVPIISCYPRAVTIVRRGGRKDGLENSCFFIKKPRLYLLGLTQSMKLKLCSCHIHILLFLFQKIISVRASFYMLSSLLSFSLMICFPVFFIQVKCEASSGSELCRLLSTNVAVVRKNGRVLVGVDKESINNNTVASVMEWVITEIVEGGGCCRREEDEGLVTLTLPSCAMKTKTITQV